jgi:hypothetical protein
VAKKRRESKEQVKGEGVDTSRANVGMSIHNYGTLTSNLTPCPAVILPFPSPSSSPNSQHLKPPHGCARHISNGPTCRAEFMKHVLPRLVRPQMPGWPWKSSSSSDMFFLGLDEKPYQLRAYYVQVHCTHRFSLPSVGCPYSLYQTPQGLTCHAAVCWAKCHLCFGSP